MQRRGTKRFAATLIAVAGLIAAGCGDEPASKPAGSAGADGSAVTKPADSGAPSSDETAATTGADLVARGELIYGINCTACHNRDPAAEGGIGPSIAGSSRELIEARVMRGEYPPGHTPKAPTQLMIPLPHLEPELDALTAFLAIRTR